MINSWSISGNSCKKIISAIRAIRLNPLLKIYSCHSSYSCSRNKSVFICAICGRIIFLCISVVSVGKQDHLMVSEYAGAVPRNSSAYAQTAVALPEW